MPIVKTLPLETTIELNDGQIVEVTLLRTGFDVGMQEELAEAAEEIPFLSKRSEKLSKLIDEATTDEEFDSRVAAFKEFRKKMVRITKMVDLTIVAVIKKWNLSLTQEDEDAGIFVPLTKEDIGMLPDVLRYDIFGKITEKVRARTEQEKKDLLVSSPNGSRIPTENRVASHLSTADTLLPNDTDSAQMRFENGQLMNSTKPS